MNYETTIIPAGADMARGGKRENSGRPKSESTKTIRIPEGALDAVEALIRLYKNEPQETDYVLLNIAIAKTKWCLERGDFTDTREIKSASRLVKIKAEELDKTLSSDPNAAEKWDEAERLNKISDEYERISNYGLDF